jgi:hypothetical protein
MDLFSIILLLVLYYVRPHEWIGFCQPIPWSKITIGLALVSLFHKHRGLGFKDIFKTPHDWFMAAYFFWIVYTSSEHKYAFFEIYNLFTFYVVTVVTLYTVPRMQKFLSWWAWLIMFLSFIGVASTMGFDPTASADRTAAMHDRLALTLSIYNNPNSLGHSIVPVIVMLYFICYWERPIFMKIATPFILALPLYCLWLTQSKGAFLTGFATLITAFTFRRNIFMQIGIIALAATLGWTAMQFLPRMSEISDSKSNGAIQGRVKAFHYGYEIVQTQTYGLGLKQFEPSFASHFGYEKAAHSTYVMIGAELGKTGLFLFLGTIYCALRTLLSAKTIDDDEERVRRILFVLLVSFLVSSWMIGWAYRSVPFLLCGAIAAFHRYITNRRAALEAHAPKPSFHEKLRELALPAELQPQPALATASASMNLRSELAAPQTARSGNIPTTIIDVPAAVVDPLDQPGITWQRIGWLDIVIVLAMTWGCIWFWYYIMGKM